MIVETCAKMRKKLVNRSALAKIRAAHNPAGDRGDRTDMAKAAKTAAPAKAAANKPMTKTMLVSALAEEMGSDKKSATAALDAIAAVITREVSNGGAVTLPGLGKIACRARPERQVRNPQTQEMMTKPADRQVKMTIAKALKDSVNM